MALTIPDAAAKGDVIAIENLLAKGNDINEKSSQSGHATGLHLAANNRHVTTVSYLVKKGANVNARADPNHNMTPLMYAVGGTNEHDAIVKMLIEAGSKINDQDTYGRTALMLACYSGGTTTQLNLLIEAGANLNVQNTYGWSALMLSCQAKRSDPMKCLLESGADVGITNNEGKRAVHIARETKSQECIKLMEEYEGRKVSQILGVTPASQKVASVQKKSSSISQKVAASAAASEREVKSLKLHKACEESKAHDVRSLLKEKYSIEERDGNGFTPLHITCSNKDISIAKILLKDDFDPNIPNNDNETAMHVAVNVGSAQIVRLLLTHPKLDPDMANKAGQTPIMLTAIGNHPNILTALLQRNDIHIDGQDNAGNAVLHYACQHGDMEMVQQVLTRKPDVTIRNENNMSPIVLAARGRKGNIVKLLMSKSLHADNILNSILAFGKSVHQIEGSLDIITPEMAREVLGRSRNIDMEEFIDKFNEKFRL